MVAKVFKVAVLLLSVGLVGCENTYFSTPKKQPPEPQPTDTAPLRVITPDWAIAGTLTAMGYPPLATGDVKFYPDWSIDPELSPKTIDMGTRYQPNPELFSQLSVDLIIDNDFYQHLRPLYGDIPHKSMKLQDDKEVASWEGYKSATYELGKIIGQPNAAKQYIKKSETKLEKEGQLFRHKNPDIKKITVVQFASANQLRSYSKNSLFYPAAQMMGLDFQELGEGNAWGFITIGLSELTKIDKETCLIIVEPFSVMVQKELSDNDLWHRLGYSFAKASSDKSDNAAGNQEAVSKPCVMVIAPTWIYGGVPSIVGFAHALNQPIKTNQKATNHD